MFGQQDAQILVGGRGTDKLFDYLRRKAQEARCNDEIVWNLCPQVKSAYRPMFRRFEIGELEQEPVGIPWFPPATNGR